MRTYLYPLAWSRVPCPYSNVNSTEGSGRHCCPEHKHNQYYVIILWLPCNGRADSRFAPSQWETALLCNDVSHWLGASLESALNGVNVIETKTLFETTMTDYWSDIKEQNVKEA